MSISLRTISILRLYARKVLFRSFFSENEVLGRELLSKEIQLFLRYRALDREDFNRL